MIINQFFIHLSDKNSCNLSSSKCKSVINIHKISTVETTCDQFHSNVIPFVFIIEHNVRVFDLLNFKISKFAIKHPIYFLNFQTRLASYIANIKPFTFRGFRTHGKSELNWKK